MGKATKILAIINVDNKEKTIIIENDVDWLVGNRNTEGTEKGE